MPQVPNQQLFSDALCVVAGFHAGNPPQNFTVSLDQSNTPRFTWSPPSGGGQASFGLLQFGGELKALDPSATSTNMPDVPPQSLVCYALGAFSVPGASDFSALTGYTDQDCAYAGFGNLGP